MPKRKQPAKKQGKKGGIQSTEPDKPATQVELTPPNHEALDEACEEVTAEYNEPQPVPKKAKKGGPLVVTPKVIAPMEDILAVNKINTTCNTLSNTLRQEPVEKSIPSTAATTQTTTQVESVDRDQTVATTVEQNPEHVVPDCPDPVKVAAANLCKLSTDDRADIRDRVHAKMRKEFTFRSEVNRRLAKELLADLEANPQFDAPKHVLKEYIETAFSNWRNDYMNSLFRRMEAARQLAPEHFNRAAYLQGVNLPENARFPCESIQSVNAKKAKHRKTQQE